jgi:3-hydroxyacyl-CoA dehydrogenase
VTAPIRSAAVLGAGTMGAQIAAHLANAGVPTLLLDLTADVAQQGLKRAATLKPDPFFTRQAAALISVGGFDQDLPKLARVDWILEAVVERLDVKRSLLEKIDAVRTPGTIVSSNTSGIPIATLAEGRSEDFRRHWLGTHFFNPPRYLRLLEIIPTADTDRGVVDRVRWFADHRLGKGVVVAKDTPNFIANHIGLFGVARTLRALESGEYTIEEIDAITGPALGRPKSATFRTMDIAGIDILSHVATNLTDRLSDEDVRRELTLPPLVQQLIERGWVGEKAGQGFYKKVGADMRCRARYA